MKSKQQKIDDGIKRLEKLKQETILRYTDEIDFDQELSLYDVMINHFAKGDLDNVFNTDVCDGMSDSERKMMFDLTREFVGLCFSNGDVDYWLDSLEDTPILDYNLIAYSIFNSFDFLLDLAKDGGRDVLELLVSLRACDDLKDTAVITYLSNTFIDDRVLDKILVSMSQNKSSYNIFTDEQKGILLNYPEGTLYCYDGNEIKITSPLVLGIEIFNHFNKDVITEVDKYGLESSVSILREFFRDGDFDFDSEVMSLVGKYRDYVRRNNITLGTNFSAIIFDEDSKSIRDAWNFGDEVLGGAYDTPYIRESK